MFFNGVVELWCLTVLMGQCWFSLDLVKYVCVVHSVVQVGMSILDCVVYMYSSFLLSLDQFWISLDKL